MGCLPAEGVGAVVPVCAGAGAAPALLGRELVEVGVLDGVVQRHAVRGVVLQHALDEVKQLPVLLRVLLQVTLQHRGGWG